MKKAVFRFTTVFDLWRFKKTPDLKVVNIKYAICTLTCQCNEAAILLAQDQFRATLLAVEEVQNIQV